MSTCAMEDWPLPEMKMPPPEPEEVVLPEIVLLFRVSLPPYRLLIPPPEPEEVVLPEIVLLFRVIVPE